MLAPVSITQIVITQLSSVAHSCLTLWNPIDCSTPGLPIHHQLLEFTQTHVHWVSDAIQPSHPSSPLLLPFTPLHSPSLPFTLLPVVPFFSHLHSFPASGSFSISGLFASSGQSFGASASAYVLLMNIQSWCPFGLAGLISLLSRGLSRVFSSTTIRKHQFFGGAPSLRSNSRIRTWLLEKP